MMDFEEQEQGEDKEFPPLKLLIGLYSWGAVSAFIFSFVGELDPGQITVCLLVSWILTIGALGMSVLGEGRTEHSEE